MNNRWDSLYKLFQNLIIFYIQNYRKAKNNLNRLYKNMQLKTKKMYRIELKF